MDRLDGNAVAGALFEHFGTEMTGAGGACAHCGARAQIAELYAYCRAPGAVLRCRACGNVVIVIVEIRGTVTANLAAFRLDG